jgi:hypothetical protein
MCLGKKKLMNESGNEMFSQFLFEHKRVIPLVGGIWYSFMRMLVMGMGMGVSVTIDTYVERICRLYDGLGCYE